MNLEEILMDDDVLSAMGYAPLTQQEALLGAIAKLPAAQKQAAMVKFLKPKATNQTNLSARGEAMIRLGALPAEIRQGLATKRLQMADTRFYVVKPAGAATTLRMIAPADTKAPGVTNIDRGKLEKDNYFLLTGIMLLSGVEAQPLAASFNTIEKGIANGDFEFTAAGNKYLLPKDSAAHVFDTSNRTDIENGLFKLDNPKWIEPQVDIEFNLRFSQALVANTNVKLILVGASVINY